MIYLVPILKLTDMATLEAENIINPGSRATPISHDLLLSENTKILLVQQALLALHALLVLHVLLVQPAVLVLLVLLSLLVLLALLTLLVLQA